MCVCVRLIRKKWNNKTLLSWTRTIEYFELEGTHKDIESNYAKKCFQNPLWPMLQGRVVTVLMSRGCINETKSLVCFCTIDIITKCNIGIFHPICIHISMGEMNVTINSLWEMLLVTFLSKLCEWKSDFLYLKMPLVHPSYLNLASLNAPVLPPQRYVQLPSFTFCLKSRKSVLSLNSCWIYLYQL